MVMKETYNKQEGAGSLTLVTLIITVLIMLEKCFIHSKYHQIVQL